MQENNFEQPPSLSKLLRETYLAEARAQQRHGETGCSDGPPTRLQLYGALKGKGEDAVGHNDTQFPDLSAFLSQEELDKSVDLAQQAIGNDSCSSGSVAARTSIATVMPPILPTVTFSSQTPSSFPASFTEPDSNEREVTATHTRLSTERKMHKPSARQDGVIRNSGNSEELSDQQVRSAPYNLETQSKKEFLNKAADFIEELSSLFKANSSKRLRPKACKSHRSRAQGKSQSDETTHHLSSDNRERAVEQVDPSTVISQPAAELHKPQSGHTEFQSCGSLTEDQSESVSQEVAEAAVEASAVVVEGLDERYPSTETAHAPDASCEPPHFIQKLKSREVAEGSKVQLDCIVRGCPFPEVRWFCEGKELENSPDIQIITNGELHSLIIAEAFEEDTGRYSCFASNFYGTDSTSAEIYVEGASSSDSDVEPHFEHTAQLQKKQYKSSLSKALKSQVPPAVESNPASSQPEEDTREHKEEKTSESSSQVQSPETPVQTQTAPTDTPIPEPSEVTVADRETLVMPVQVFPTSQEEATSIPIPSAAQSEQTDPTPSSPSRTSRLPIPSPLAQTVQLQGSLLDHPQISNGQPAMSAPVFTKSLQDLSAAEGQLVVLECRVRGLHSPQVDWYREGNLLQDSPEFRILQKKEIHTLVIAEVFAEDSGMFTCTASNKYGSVSSSAALRVKGNDSGSAHVRAFSSSVPEPARVQVLPPPTAAAAAAASAAAVKLQPDVIVTSSIKPHSTTIRLDPLISNTVWLDPLSTSQLHLEPHSSSLLRPDPHRSNLSTLEPPILSSSSVVSSSSTSHVDPPPVNLQETDGPHPSVQSTRHVFSISKVTSSQSPEQDTARAKESSPDRTPRVIKRPKPQSEGGGVVSLPDPPPNSCLKTGTLTNHKDRAGLRVHFKLPEEEERAASSGSESDFGLGSGCKEPPPVLAKPKLDPAQLQLLHNQVLLEQQQTEADTHTPTRTQTPSKPQPPRSAHFQPEVQTSQEAPLWSPRMHREPQTHSFEPQISHYAPPTTPLPPPPAQSASQTISMTFPPPLKPTPHLSYSSFSSPAPQIKSSSLTCPPPIPLLSTASPATVHMNQAATIHASHLNLSPAALSRPAAKPELSFPPAAPKLSAVPADLHLQQTYSPVSVLRSAHASLMNLTSISTFNYARPKEFIAAQAMSPVMSPSPTESPVPLLQELAAELNSSVASSPVPTPFSPPLRLSPTRLVTSPSAPPSLVSSPTPGSSSFLNSLHSLRAQSPPQASSPTSSSSTPSPIQNPVAFLSSVLPSLTPSQPTNSMGLPKGAPLRVQKKAPQTRLPSAENIRNSKELLIQDIEKILRLKDTAHQQKLSNKGETASRPPGPNIPATVINYDEEYKVSNFEQRLMSEIEFRLERTPVEESDDEVQHDDVPTGKCIAPIFDKKLKNFKAVEGVPVTFSCKVVGVPPPKVYWFKDGKQILRKNTHYRKMREGDGTCALHIESTTNDDDGNYTIMVANPQGRISCSGHLIVQSGPPRNRLAPIHTQRVRSRVQEVEGEQTQERFFRPHFLQSPGDTMAHEGKLCRLDCKVSGLPSPELMWLVDGRPIYPDLTHKMLVRENSVHSLVIDPVIQNDAGTYTCIASNKAGQSSFSLELKVVEKEMKHPPQFVEKLQNMGVPEGSPVRLECRVVGVPLPSIYWKKDNETVSKTKHRMSMAQDATGYVCLLIQATTKDDAGWYTVSAKNDAGIVSCTCRLDIYAQWHQSVPAPMRKAPPVGSRYAALTGQGLDIKSAFPTSDTSPILFASSPPEARLESEEL